MSPLFELTAFHAFADDNHAMVTGSNLDSVIVNMQRKMELMTKWLQDSGLTVNESKTECCLFYKNDHQLIDIVINGVTIRSKNSINVLGVLYDSKLNWQAQVAQTISKSKKTLHAIKLVKNYFSKKELEMLITSNFYSVLYYNCEIWLTPNLDPRSKQHLLGTSAMALKIMQRSPDPMVSYENLHEINKRAKPCQMMEYKLAIQLYKLYNSETMNDDWLDLNFQQTFNHRNNYAKFFDNSRIRIGKNSIVNRLSCLNGKIDYDWLNQSLNSYKLKCKLKFLS